jgi:hypothetical protein
MRLNFAGMPIVGKGNKFFLLDCADDGIEHFDPFANKVMSGCAHYS